MLCGNSSVHRTIGRVGRAAAVALLATALSVGVAHGQEGARKPVRTLVSVNPLGLPFEYVSAEIENKVTNLATLGTSLSWIDLDNTSYFSVEAKLRFYPNEEAFKGFSLGIAGGVSHFSEQFTDREDNSATRPSIAVLADYNWMLGKSKRVVVGTGVGAKRIFGKDDGFDDISLAYPTARFQVGVTF